MGMHMSGNTPDDLFSCTWKKQVLLTWHLPNLHWKRLDDQNEKSLPGSLFTSSVTARYLRSPSHATKKEWTKQTKIRTHSLVRYRRLVLFFFFFKFFPFSTLECRQEEEKRIVAVLFGVRMQNSKTSPFQPNCEFVFISETLWTRLCECVIFVFCYVFTPELPHTRKGTL